MNSYIYLLLYASTLVACIWRYGRYKQLRYKLFLPLLAVIVLYEVGFMRKWWFIHHSTLWSANIEITIEYIFYCFFIISSFRNPKERKGFSIGAWVIFIFTLVDILLIQGIMRLCNIAIVIQYALLIVLVCRFFYDQLQTFDGETSLLRQPDFWVNTGLLFFSLSEFLFFSAFSLAYTPSHYFSILFQVISAVANIILYSCLITAFLCQPRNRTPSLS
jgi:hypothetical protein